MQVSKSPNGLVEPPRKVMRKYTYNRSYCSILNITRIALSRR